MVLLVSTPIAYGQTTVLTEPVTYNLVTYYPDSQGYDVVKRPDGTIWIYSQRYHVEYNDGKNWKQVGVPYQLTRDGDTVTRYYTDYINTEYRVVTNTDTRKTDVILYAGKTGEYRIVWNLDGVTNTEYTITGSQVKFSSGSDWVAADWSSAEAPGVPTVSDSANGKKLEVIFNIGPLTAGETYTLDPVLIDSYTGGGGINSLQATHPSAGAPNSAVGQTFNATQDFNIGNVTFQLQKIGNPTGTAYVYLYAHSGTFGVNGTPTGASLAESNGIDVSTIAGVATDYNFTFTGSDQYKCLEGTQYCIAVLIPSGVVNVGNEIRITVDQAGGTHDGHGFYYDNSAWHNLSADYDVYFYLYSSTEFNSVAELIDEAFSYFGIVDYMEQITDFITGLSTWFNTSLTRILALITLQFTVITEVYGFFFYWAGAMIGIVLDFSEWYQSILTDTATFTHGLGDIWNLTGYDSWAPAVPLFLFLYWLCSLESRGEQTVGGIFQVVIYDINTAINLISYFSGIFIFVANTVIDRAYGLISAIT